MLGKDYLGFSDIDLVFQVKRILNVKFWLKKLVCILFLEPKNGLKPNFMFCVTGIVQRFDKILVALTQLSRTPYNTDCNNVPCLRPVS